MAFEIEMGVPLPEGRSRLGVRAAIKQLVKAPVGASVVLSGVGDYTANGAVQAVGGGGWASIRKIEKGVFRVWKIAEPKKPVE